MLRLFSAAIASLGGGLARQGCKLSSQSCLMTASSSSAARVAEALEAQGVPAAGQRQGGDLGVD
eukprot:3526583-Pyramimonas_sp.AAC.1